MKTLAEQFAEMTPEQRVEALQSITQVYCSSCGESHPDSENWRWCQCCNDE